MRHTVILRGKDKNGCTKHDTTTTRTQNRPKQSSRYSTLPDNEFIEQLYDKYNIELNSKSLYMLLDKEQINNNIVINSTLQHMTYETILKYKKEFNINFNNIIM
jgi:hypothetical protein